MAEPMKMARQIALDREISPSSERWIVDSFSAWWIDGSDPARLPMFLRLPTSSRCATERRNHWLKIAADDLPIKNRASELKRLIDSFMRDQWPSWRGSANPPEDADIINHALFYAADTGASMRLTRRQVWNIIYGK